MKWKSVLPGGLVNEMEVELLREEYVKCQAGAKYPKSECGRCNVVGLKIVRKPHESIGLAIHCC